MIILAIETSHTEASVALLVGDSLFEERIVSEKRHEETVMPRIASLLDQNAISISDIDMVAVDNGPGSFTGIRIGICHANAIADAADIPCIGISALEAMAYKKNGIDPVGVMIDAGNNNCYCAAFNKDLQMIYGPSAEPTDEFFVHIASMGGADIVKDIPDARPSAKEIALLAKQKQDSIESSDLRATPLYLRPSQAERKRKA